MEPGHCETPEKDVDGWGGALREQHFGFLKFQVLRIENLMKARDSFLNKCPCTKMDKIYYAIPAASCLP